MSVLDLDFVFGSSVDGVPFVETRGVTGYGGLSVAVYSSPGGDMLADLSPRLRGGKFSTSRHGPEAFYGFYPCTQGEAFRLYDRPGLPHVSIAWRGLPLWVGRLEDTSVNIDIGGVNLGALGYWRALKRGAPYTALWSATRLDGWRPVTSGDAGFRNDKLYQFENNLRLQVALTKNSVYAHAADVGSLALELPDDPERIILKISGSYSYNLPTNWVFRVRTADSSFADVDTRTITSAGGAGSGSLTWTPGTTANGFKAIIETYNGTGSNYTNTSENGVYYIRFTDIRVWTLNAAAVYASDIAGALAAFVSGVNPTQLSANAALIENPGVDLRDEIYEDEYPADILDRLAALGDGSNVWETGVDLERYLYLRRRGSQGRTWYTNAVGLVVNRSIESLTNSAYAVYQEPGGRTLRTAKSTDADSVARWGETVVGVVRAQTTNASQAGSHRDVFLDDYAAPIPQAQFRIGAIYDAAGTRYPKFIVKAGDTIVAQNLPPTLTTDVDRIRSFRCDATEYMIDTDELNATPESALPSLELMVARQAAGIYR